MRIRVILDGELETLYHIGSTSVPGLAAKPIIDIMGVVHNIMRVDLFNQAMVDVGYEPMGEFGIPGRRYFRKGGDIRTHHVHVFEIHSAHIARHLAFRDYLRSHPEEAQKYGSLKHRLAQQFPGDIDAYIKGKEDLVQAIERKAVMWSKKEM